MATKKRRVASKAIAAPKRKRRITAKAAPKRRRRISAPGNNNIGKMVKEALIGGLVIAAAEMIPTTMLPGGEMGKTAALGAGAFFLRKKAPGAATVLGAVAAYRLIKPFIPVGIGENGMNVWNAPGTLRIEPMQQNRQIAEYNGMLADYNRSMSM